MESIQKVVLELLRATIFQNKIELTETLDWKSIFGEMKLQTVAAMPTDLITTHPAVPDQARMAWQREAMKNAAIYTRLLYEQNALTVLLKENGISSVIMKGMAAAMYYPKPEYRAMGDIDLLVCPEDFSKTCKVLEENGYDLYRGALEGHHHAEYFKNDCMIEVHYQFNSGRGEESDQYLANLLYDEMEKIRWISIDGYDIPVLPKLTNGLIILQHIANHLKGGLGLRQMIDWMMYVHHEMDKTFWQESFLPAARFLHLEKLAIVATEMGRLYLGLPEESCAFYDAKEEELAKELMDYVFTKGNFGRKAKANEKGVGVFSNRTLWDFVKSLQSRGESHWEAYHKHHWLRPFAWLYQLFRYMSRALKRKDALQAVKKDYEVASRRKQFFEHLDIDPNKLPDD